MKKHLGSTLALILGALCFAGSFTNREDDGFVGGPIIIFGALAYRSAKKRKLGEVENSSVRKGLEIAAIFTIVAMILFHNDLANKIYYQPTYFLTIPLWAVIAYLFVVFDKIFGGSVKKRIALAVGLFILLNIVIPLGVIQILNNAP